MYAADTDVGGTDAWSVRTAADHHDRVGAGFANGNVLHASIGIVPAGPLADEAGVSDSADRHVHHPEDRVVVENQGDVDGEFSIAIDELLCSVQRIDQPVLKPVCPDIVIDGRRFF